MATDVFDLFARLSIDTSAYETGLTKARGMATKVGGKIASGFSKLAQASTIALTAASTAGMAFTKNAVQTGLSFDAAMGEVAATAGKTAEELAETTGTVNTAYGEFNGTLRDFAKFMGKNTAFTATEAAQALNYMALAGYSTQQSMEMLPAVLDMAAAGSMDLARASDMITDTQSALGLSSERTALMVDEFAKAAATGNTSVEQLGEAFLTVGGLGAELNNSFVTLADGTVQEIDNIQQLEIAFTAMANSGVKGSEAGTHMRNMLLKLANPTKDGAEAFERMGIEIFDAEGKMKSLNEIFGMLNRSFSQMSQQEKLQAIGDIFNARDTASAEALLGAVESDWDRIGESILQAKGSATQMANTKLDNLQGQLTKMKSALEGAKIALSDKIVPALKNLAKWGTDAIGKLTDAFEKDGFSGVVEVFGDLLSEGLQKAIEKLPDLVGVAKKLLEALGKGILENLDKVGDTVTQVLGYIIQTAIEALPGLITAAGSILEKIVNFIMENADQILDAVVNVVMMLIDYVSNNIDKFVNAAMQLIQKIVAHIPEIILPLVRAIPGIITTIISTISENLPTIIQGLMGVIVEIANELPNILASIIDVLPDLIEDILDAVIDSLPLIIEGLVNVVLAIVGKIDVIIVALVKAIPKIIAKLIKAVLKAIPMIIKGLIQLVVGIVKALPQIIKGLIEAIPDIIKAILEAFGDLGEGVIGIFSGIFDAAGAILGPIVDVIKGIFEGIGEFLSDPIENIKSFFTDIYDWGKQKLEDIGQFFSDVWNGFTGLLEEPLRKIKEFFTGCWDACRQAFDWIRDKVSNVFDWIGEKLSWLGDKLKSLLPDSWTGVGEATGTVAGTVIKPKMAKGGVLEKGQMGFLEGNGAEAVVPLENNYKWIHAVARDMQGALGAGKSTVNNTGTITVKGVNNQGEFVASADYVIDQILAGLRHDARLSYG